MFGSPSNPLHRSFPRTLILIGVLVAIAPLPVDAVRRWERYYQWDYDEDGRAIIQTPDSCYIVTGATTSFGPGAPDSPNPFLIKLDPAGEIIWKHVYGTDAPEIARAVDRSADGGLIIGGSSTLTDTDDDFLAIRTDSAGSPLWIRKYGRAGWWDNCMAALAPRCGGFIFVGVTARYGTPGDLYVVRTNLSGAVVWSGFYGASYANEVPFSIQETANGGFIIGATRRILGSLDSSTWLLKLDAFGESVWSQSYPGSCYSVCTTDDGGYAIAGNWVPYGSSYGDVYVLKVHSGGEVQWKMTFGGPSTDEARSIHQLADSSYIVCGGTLSYGMGHNDLLALRLNRKGEIEWWRTYGGVYDEWGYAASTTLDGGAIFTGYETTWGPGVGIYVVKIDPDGNHANALGAGNPSRPLLHVTGAGGGASPNPFISFTSVPDGTGERFTLYDVLGRRAGEYGGDRIGADLPPGVYLLRRSGSSEPAFRIVKTR